MHIRRVLLLFLGIVLSAASASSAGSFKFVSTVLYQPDEALQTRLGDVEELATYITRLTSASAEFFASEKTPERLDIVVGLKPEKKARVWFVSSRRTSQDKSLVALRKKLEAIPPCTVRGGPVAFALRCTIAGGGSPAKSQGEIPMPKEWRDATAGESVLLPDGVFERIWRD
jgi:hypothetical protein